jgi:serine/threonine protein kinase
VRGDGTLLFTPRQVFLPLAASCAGGSAIILVLARDREVAHAAAAAFGIASIISLLLATVWGRPEAKTITRVLAVGALGASATLPGWYFGPSSAYAGIVASILLFAGVLLGGRDTPFPTGGAWAVAIGLIGGQATVATLVFAGVLRDVSLLPVIPPNATTWHHIAAHLTVLAVYVAAFAIGRQLHKRYWQLSEDLDVSTRAVARREALLDEARAEYRRTFALGREGVFAGHTIGRYQLGELIGRGGAGEVYSARDVIDGSLAAVKLLRADRLNDDAKVRGFLEEATILTQIDNPHVVRTRHVGGATGDELPYIAMEKLDGETLAQRIAKRGRLDRGELRALIEGGTAALAATHAAGAVHGDVSPSNLVLAGSTWKLIDFGLGAAGTPRFVAPERLAGAAASQSSDLYGFAACVYLAITGNEPFAGVPVSALPAIASRELPMDPRLSAEVSSDLADVLAVALACSEGDRFRNAKELGAALLAPQDNALDDALRSRIATAPSWSVAPPIVSTDDTESQLVSTQRPQSRNAEPDQRVVRDQDLASAPLRELRVQTSEHPSGPRAISTSQNGETPVHEATKQNQKDRTILEPSPAAVEYPDEIGENEKGDGPRSPSRRSLRDNTTDSLAAPAGIAAHVLATVPASGPQLSLEWLGAPAGTTTVDTMSSGAWRGAFADRMRIQYLYVLVACAVGAGLILAIAPSRWMLGVALVTIGIAALVVAIEQRVQREWPWMIVAALAIGPAYVLGLHSGFAAVIVVVLFIECSFKSSPTGFTGRGFTLAAVLVTHAGAFAAIQLGVLPDEGVTPVLHHDPAWSGWVIQGLVLSIYVTAFVIGKTTQARYAELVRRNEVAAREAAQKQALLATARAEVDRVLAGFSGGLFTGSKIGGYAIGRLLGRGGMGEVYVGTKDGKELALKLIRADKVGGATLRRFGLEAEALTRVDSPYVARVIEVGTEDGRLPYMAMELAEGRTLADVLREQDRLERGDQLALLRDAARGLGDVHRAGVVHRDVKPNNLIRGARWKLVDFGIAVIEDAPRATTGNMIVGTPAYMAPEQLLGGSIDARTDLYSLGLVLYRVLAGRPAFTTERVKDPKLAPPDPGVLGVPPALCHVLRIALAHDPADRFASASELEAAFEAAFEDRLEEPIAVRAQRLAAREPWRN